MSVNMIAASLRCSAFTLIGYMIRFRDFSLEKKLCGFISVGRRQGPLCAKMHPSAGPREDLVTAYLRANRADRHRVAGVRVPTIRMPYPCHSDRRKPRQSDTHRFR